MRLILIITSVFFAAHPLAQAQSNDLIGKWVSNSADAHPHTFRFSDSTKMSWSVGHYPEVDLVYESKAHHDLYLLKLIATKPLGEKYEVRAIIKFLEPDKIQIQLFDDAIEHFSFEEKSDAAPFIITRQNN